MIEPTAKNIFPEFKLKDKYKVNSSILKEISRGFRKKIKKRGSIGHFSYQNGRQSQKIGCKTVNSHFYELKLCKKQF